VFLAGRFERVIGNDELELTPLVASEGTSVGTRDGGEVLGQAGVAEACGKNPTRVFGLTEPGSRPPHYRLNWRPPGAKEVDLECDRRAQLIAV